MDAKREIEWKGWGRWLSFALSAMLILIAIPSVLDNETGASAGWNIFLGLLMFGAIASGHEHAPRIALILAGLMALRFAISIFAGGDAAIILIELLFVAVSAGGAYDLRQQARTS